MSLYTYNQVERLKKKYKTSDPFELLDCMNVVVKETSNYQKLKGYCFVCCRTTYVMISSFLSEEEKRLVAAHELGHIVLHKDVLKAGPIADTTLMNIGSKMEFEANMFAADLLISDDDVNEACDSDDDFYTLCSKLYVEPDIMSFKLQSLIQRGGSFTIPTQLNSRFLAK